MSLKPGDVVQYRGEVYADNIGYTRCGVVVTCTIGGCAEVDWVVASEKMRVSHSEEYLRRAPTEEAAIFLLDQLGEP
jgi:hypothetical protein